MLPAGSAEPGPWRSDRTPYTIPIAAACADPHYRRVVAVMGSQMGKTAGLLNVIGHKLDDDPAPILYIGPTKSNVDGVIEPQIYQMLRSAPSLWSKTLHGRKAQKLIKRVSGVTLRLAWAGSATELASQPAHTVLVDEVDRMAPIPGEGDPVSLAEARIATYPDGRLIITSTPTEGNVSASRHPKTGVEHWDVAEPEDLSSAVWRLWQEGTRHEWAVPCPECDTYFVPRFKLLTWPEGCTPKRALKDARLACPSCGALIADEHRSRMNARGHYLAPGQRVEAGRVAVTVDHVGGLDVAAAHELLDHLVARHRGLLRIRPGLLRIDHGELAVADALDRLHHRDRVVDVQQVGELARVDEARHVARPVDLGRPHREVDEPGRRHRVATRVRRARTDQRRESAGDQQQRARHRHPQRQLGARHGPMTSPRSRNRDSASVPTKPNRAISSAMSK